MIADDFPARVRAASEEAVRLARSVNVMPALRPSLGGKITKLRDTFVTLEQEIASRTELDEDTRDELTFAISEGRLDLLYCDGTVDEAGPTSLRLSRILRSRGAVPS